MSGECGICGNIVDDGDYKCIDLYVCTNLRCRHLAGMDPRGPGPARRYRA